MSLKKNHKWLSMIFFILIFIIRHIASYNAMKHREGLWVVDVVVYFALIVSLPLGFSLLFEKNRKINYYLMLFVFFFLAYTTSYVLLSPDYSDTLGRTARDYNLSIFFHYLIYFSAGYYFSPEIIPQKYVYAFFCLLTINALINFDVQTYRISFEGFSSEKIGVYQFLGDSYALCSLLAISIGKRRILSSYLLLVIVLAVLFFLNSRTSLYSFFGVSVFFILGIAKKKFLYFLYSVSTVAILGIYINFKDLLEKNIRMFAFLDLSKDSSMTARSELIARGLQGIKENWYLGDYAGQLVYGHFGSYIHNYLSIWRQFGLIPFLIIILFLLIFIIYVLKTRRIFKKTSSPGALYLVLGGLFCFIEIIFARSYNSPYIWFFWGMLISGRYSIPFLSSDIMESHNND